MSVVIIATPSATAASSVRISAGDSSPDRHASTPAPMPWSGLRISWPESVKSNHVKSQTHRFG